MLYGVCGYMICISDQVEFEFGEYREASRLVIMWWCFDENNYNRWVCPPRRVNAKPTGNQSVRLPLAV